MQSITLGRTNLQATVAGLGCGGFSRLGLAQYGEEHAASVARAAFDLGVNFFDTSAAYGTEQALGKGLEGIPRGQYILSSKFPYTQSDGSIHTPETLMRTLENSLRALQTDCIEIYHLHALTLENYDRAVDILMPALQQAQSLGKIRFIGVTEQFGADTEHAMLMRALPDDLFDVVMVGFNLLNPSARERVLAATIRQRIGVLCMFAVRTALSRPAQLKADIETILKARQGGTELVADEHALDFLTRPGVADSVMQAAYRFCRHTPGIDVTLTGTGSVEHLKDNLQSIQMPPLPQEALRKLEELFGNVDCVSGQ